LEKLWRAYVASFGYAQDKTWAPASMIANCEATRQDRGNAFKGRSPSPMKQVLVPLIALSITAAIAQSVDTVSKNPKELADEKLLLQMEHDWNEALKTRNMTWFEQNLAGDMTDIVSANGTLYTKEQDIESLKTDQTNYELMELSDMKVRVEGNAGIVTGVNRIKARDQEGQIVEVRFAFTDVYIKREGHWQVWASQHTRIIP
jgi:ketosteroid isomerase-like protein